MLAALDALDQRDHLKSRMLVESGTTASWYADFRASGWRTAYTMPTEKMLDLLQAPDRPGMTRLADAVAAQLRAQNVAAIAFDARAWPFIKGDVQPRIPSSIAYAVRQGPSISDSEFLARFGADPLFRNPRVDTLLVGFASPYGS